MIITSFNNPKIKLIRKLEQKKYRQETGLFFIEGLRIVGEAIQTGAPIQSMVTAPELLTSTFGKELLDLPKAKDVDQLEVSAEVFQNISQKDGPQGIGAVVRQNWQTLKDLPVDPDDLFVILDEIADPGNLGTILRTADAVGGKGVILLGETTDPFNPTAVKASMGAIFTLQLVQTKWAPVYSWCVANQMMLVGTSDKAKTDYQTVDYRLPLALLMGSERHGLSTSVQKACNHLVRIPLVGRMDSLNLAVATGVMLYEIYNQKRKTDTINA